MSSHWSRGCTVDNVHITVDNVHSGAHCTVDKVNINVNSGHSGAHCTVQWIKGTSQWIKCTSQWTMCTMEKVHINVINVHSGAPPVHLEGASSSCASSFHLPTWTFSHRFDRKEESQFEGHHFQVFWWVLMESVSATLLLSSWLLSSSHLTVIACQDWPSAMIMALTDWTMWSLTRLCPRAKTQLMNLTLEEVSPLQRYIMTHTRLFPDESSH